MKLSEGLIKLARISPKEYRIAILERNQILLEKLMMLKPYVEKVSVANIPSKVLDRVKSITCIGCPHCAGCTNCLWNVAFKSHDMMPCVQKNHFTDNDWLVRDSGNIAVVYWNKSEQITIDFRNQRKYEKTEEIDGIDMRDCIDRKQWERCIKYVKGHIQWAKLSCWGKDYKG